jgi:ribonucleotide reductase alpha subunit
MTYYNQTQIGGEIQWTEIGSELPEEHKNKTVINLTEKDYKERVSKHPEVNRVFRLFIREWTIQDRKAIWNTSPQPFMEKSKWILAYDEIYKQNKKYLTESRGHFGKKLAELAWERGDPFMINHSSIYLYIDELLNYMSSSSVSLDEKNQGLQDLYYELKEEQEMEEVNAPSPETLILKIGISQGANYTKAKVVVVEIPDEIKKIFKTLVDTFLIKTIIIIFTT